MILCLALSLVWMLSPDVLLRTWDVGYTESAGLVGRRSAALFLGVGFMMFNMRTWRASPQRTAMADGFALSCVTLAALGLFELWRGNAGMGIALAAVVELLAACALAFTVRAKV